MAQFANCAILNLQKYIKIIAIFHNLWHSLQTMPTILDSLTPTLWRTCRAVANLQRLRLFNAMIDQPPQSMGVIAKKCEMPKAVCCQYMRQLNARGLCMATRKSRWVYYHLQADPKVRHSEIIMQALITELRSANDAVYKQVFRDLTTFAHPRRIDIVLALGKHGKTDCLTLCKRCKFSRRAMERQLDKLVRRGIVGQKDGCFFLVSPRTPLAKTLVKIVFEPSVESM